MTIGPGDDFDITDIDAFMEPGGATFLFACLAVLGLEDVRLADL